MENKDIAFFIENFPSGKQLFPFKRYESYEEYYKSLNAAPFKTNHIGEEFQKLCRLPEWKAAEIVWSKYKRKQNLEHFHLVKLRNHIVSFSENRKAQGKKCSNDFLIQECSAEVKRWLQSTS